MVKTNTVSWWRTEFGDEEAEKIANSIANENISQGPVTEEFERAIAQKLGVPYVIATTSGSMAILMALIVAGIKPQDEVIVPNRTWIATAHAPLLLGAKVVLVDVEPNRPIIDVSQIEEKITKKTKVIMPVHLNGRAANMEAINKIAKEHGLLVIEDAAQAFYSKNRDGFLGAQSFAGCFSLSVAKIIASGQGGFVVTRDKSIYEKLKLIRTHGVRDVVNVSYTSMGFNFRFTDILASIGLVQLGKIDKRVKKVKNIYQKYVDALKGMSFLKIIPVNILAGEVPVYVEVLCHGRGKIMQFLKEHDIETRPFYPDLNKASYFSATEEYPNSQPFGENGLYLPCGPAQPLGKIDYVINVLRKYQESL